ncbi:hypothetical protein DH2020_020356 [Rehmannia glutinosa]|uniref:Zinc finger BED domain-containing protein RICESLEEPER 2-like n=1 Tax=Rehmannia glutinosa TaxID=99300 RepID=A0ABR0WJM3_REHGL
MQKRLHTEKQKTLHFQPAKSKFEINPLSDGKYDHKKQREAIAHWILMHEKPFSVMEDYGFTFMFKISLPQFEKVSRPTAKNDVISVYDIEKKKFQLILRSINKISLTTDIWKSKVQKISYICVTGYFVDSNWELQKRVLSFMPLPSPHTGVDIFDGLMKCTKDWRIEHKIFTISVDNASNKDIAIRIASHKLPLDGKLFHVRCAAHILNLVVQDGLSTIKYIIEDVKDSVRFINQSKSRLMKFSDIVHHLGIPVKNSTYEIVKHVLDEKENHPSEFIKGMIKQMKHIFDKYWGDCNILMAIGAILDPRFKMRLVDFAFNKIYNEFDARTNVKNVRDALYDLFFEYVQVGRMKTQKDRSSMSDKGPSVSSTSSISKGKIIPSGLYMFDQYLNTVQDDVLVKSELDIYLEEGVFRCRDGEVASEFDALAWWKSHELKFNILSKLALDVLVVISTVASEATFSAGTQVLDPYRAKLSSDMVQVLICGADWLRHLHGAHYDICKSSFLKFH